MDTDIEPMEIDGPSTSADINPDDSHAVIRQNRRIKVWFSGTLEVNVIEPPQVFDAEIEQALRRQIMSACAGLKLGSPSAVAVDITTSEPGA